MGQMPRPRSIVARLRGLLYHAPKSLAHHSRYPDTMLNKPFKVLFFVLVLLTCAAVIAACGTAEPDNPAPTPPPAPDPVAILQDAADRFEALEFFKFTMLHENGGTPITFGLVMEDVTGDVAAPDRLQADIGAFAGNLFFDVTLVAIGDRTFLTNPFTKEFEEIDGGVISSALLDPATGISGIIRDAVDPVLEGEADIDGAQTYHLTSVIDSAQLTSIAPSAEPGLPIEVGIWIGKDDSLVYKIYMVGPMSSDEETNITRTILISAFDIPVEIAMPDLEADS